MLDILLYPESSIRPTIVGMEKIFQIKVLRRFENAIFRLIFHRKAILLIFLAELTESMLLWAHQGWFWGKIFKMEVLVWLF